MKDWQIILAVLVGVLALRFIFRERFQDSPTGVRGPPYSDTDVIKMLDLNLSKSDDDAASSDFVKGYRNYINNLRRTNSTIPPADIRTENGRNQIFGIVKPYFERFYNNVYSPATTPITEEQVRASVDANLPSTRPAWLNAEQVENLKKLMKKYYVDQPPGPVNAPTTEAQRRAAMYSQTSGFGYYDVLRELGQDPTNATQDAIIAEMNRGPTGGTGTTGGTTTSSTGATGTSSSTTSSTGTTGTSSSTTSSTGATGGFSGNNNTTTGGSTTSSWGPSGDSTGARGFNVFGPEFAGVGESIYGGANGYDSTQSTSYPELLGGRNGPSKTRVDGVGMINPSVNAPGMNANLPDWNTLGRSLMPGDQDPYRVSQTFSPSSYSSRGSDPVPFLTDFSAFLK